MPLNNDSKKPQNFLKVRSYLNRDFDGFRKDLEDNARTFFPDVALDYSSNNISGMLMDLVSYVGDNTSFYMDHQFHETNPLTAVEPKNIENHLRNSGVKITGASPAVVKNTFYIKVPKDPLATNYVPYKTALPKFHEGTTVTADNGTTFELLKTIDFAETDKNDNYLATITVDELDSNNHPISFIFSKEEYCVSGTKTTETFAIGEFTPFKRITLANENVTEIISVRDSEGNEYYEVEYHTQDIVFKSIINPNYKLDGVASALKLIPAPYRFITETSLETRYTTLVFGGGSAESLDTDIIPDPSDFALPLYGKETFSRFKLDPNNLLNTSTLGVLQPNTSIIVEYRYGGGGTHNIDKETIRGIETLNITFPLNPPASVAASVASSADANNLTKASGGLDAPTAQELQALIPQSRAAQSRAATKEDLLIRIHKMPTNFGKVFRAAASMDPDSPSSINLYILCKDSSGLAYAPDLLKINLATFLNEFRMNSGIIEILDGQIINFGVEYAISVSGANKQLVLKNINTKLRKYLSLVNFQINMPLNLDEIRSIIFNTQGVISVQKLSIKNLFGIIGEKTYSDISFSPTANIKYGSLIYPPVGGMFELKYLEDISGTAL